MTAKHAAIAATTDRTTAIHTGVKSTPTSRSAMLACIVPTSVSIVATFPSMEVTVPCSVPRVVLTVATSPEIEVTLASKAAIGVFIVKKRISEVKLKGGFYEESRGGMKLYNIS